MPRFLRRQSMQGREDIFERDVSGLLRGEQLFPMTVSVHAHSLCRIRYLTKQGRDAHRGRCPYCSSHSARRPLERTSQNRALPSEASEDDPNKAPPHSLVKAPAVAGAEEQVALPKAILPGLLWCGLHGRSVPFATAEEPSPQHHACSVLRSAEFVHQNGMSEIGQPSLSAV